MGYPSMTRNFRAEATATGNMDFNQQSVGFFVDVGRENIYAGDVDDWNFDVQIGGAATVKIQGNNWDPDTAADWYDISSVTSSSIVQKGNYAAKFLRANVSSYTSGSVIVNFIGEQ